MYGLETFNSKGIPQIMQDTNGLFLADIKVVTIPESGKATLTTRYANSYVFIQSGEYTRVVQTSGNSYAIFSKKGNRILCLIFSANNKDGKYGIELGGTFISNPLCIYDVWTYQGKQSHTYTLPNDYSGYAVMVASPRWWAYRDEIYSDAVFMVDNEIIVDLPVLMDNMYIGRDEWIVGRSSWMEQRLEEINEDPRYFPGLSLSGCIMIIDLKHIDLRKFI